MNTRTVGVLVAVASLVVLAHPLYLFPHHGETASFLSQVERIGERAPAETIAYEELPPVGKDRFEQALEDNFSEDVWSGEHAAAYEALSEHQYVRYRGDYYQYQFRDAGDFGGGMRSILRMVLSTLAVIALVVGVFTTRTGRRRPLTPRRALWIPVGVFAVLVATEYYDAAAGGAVAPPSPVHLPAMAAAFVAASVVGSAVRHRGSLRPLLPVALLVVAGTGVTIATGHASAVGAGLFAFTLVTTPWFALGYRLTGSPKST
ncbi:MULTISPECIES: hypothetical protein [Halorussus]|uniref:hypothetical protein n=1 Tax=Halorussus TaxID=1070314 RepID=UPI000E20DA64|nr:MULTISPECIES: hypothetical protein [Halorussus]NHN58425.1 hypothetical protein [Halorussus sp. JP-T4]